MKIATSPQGLKTLGLITLLAVHMGLQSLSAQGWNNGQSATSVLGQPDFQSDDSNRGQTQPSANTLEFPEGVAVDPTTGKVFIADTSNHRVLRFSSTDALENGADAEAVLGQSDFESGAFSLSSTRMKGPGHIWINATGTLWVPDIANSRVLRFDNASSKTDGSAADGVLGQPNFFSDTAATTQNGMNKPRAVVEGTDGTLWVADTQNHRVLRFDDAVNKANGANADAVLGQTSFTTKSEGLSATEIRGPSHLAISPGGTLWVSGGNNRVLRFNNASSKSTFGASANGVLGQPDFTSNAVTQVSVTPANGPFGFYSPNGLALDSNGNLWVRDGVNNRAMLFTNAASKANGAAASKVLGAINLTTLTSHFGNYPADWTFFGGGGLFAEGSGRLWLVDSTNSRVMRFEGGGSNANAARRTAILAKVKSLQKQIKKSKRLLRKLTTKNKKKAMKRTIRRKIKQLKNTLFLLHSLDG